MGGTTYTPTLEDLIAANPLKVALAAQGALQPQPDTSAMPAGISPQSLPQQGLIPPTQGITDPRKMPTVPANPLPQGPLALTRAQNPQVGPGLNARPYAPSFTEAATDPQTGLPGQINPQETKLGKLVHILAGAAQGALAGWGTGNPGAGAAAAREIPFQQAQQANELALQRAGLQPAETPYGPMPASLAVKVFPSMIRANASLGVQGLRGQTQEDIEKQRAASAQNVAQINKRFIVVPGVGVYDTALKTGKEGQESPALLPGTSQSITVTPELAQEYQLPAEFVGKPMKLTDLAAVQRSSVFHMAVQTGEGPVVVNRRTAQGQPVMVNGQRASSPAMAGLIEVPDPNNPGQTMIVRKEAVAGGAGGGTPAQPAGGGTKTPAQPFMGKGSATHQAAVAVTKSAIAGKIGEEINAFNTALQHANLLESAARALNNNDPQTINSLKNRLKAEFGATGPIDARVINEAYNREITKMLSSNHITDNEIKEAGGSLDATGFTLDQTLHALDVYRALAGSKMRMRQQQVERGQQGQANFPQEVTHIVNDRNGNRIGTVVDNKYVPDKK